MTQGVAGRALRLSACVLDSTGICRPDRAGLPGFSLVFEVDHPPALDRVLSAGDVLRLGVRRFVFFLHHLVDHSACARHVFNGLA